MKPSAQPDQAHFSHMFIRSEGITPFAWRCRTVRALSQQQKIAAFASSYRSSLNPVGAGAACDLLI
jgi:hypothetical protein